MSDDIYLRLTKIFRDVFDNDEVTATPELTADDVEEWDSLSNIRVFIAVEKEFGVRFATSEITSLANVGELAAAIVKKQSAK